MEQNTLTKTMRFDARRQLPKCYGCVNDLHNQKCKVLGNSPENYYYNEVECPYYKQREVRYEDLDEKSKKIWDETLAIISEHEKSLH